MRAAQTRANATGGEPLEQGPTAQRMAFMTELQTTGETFLIHIESVKCACTQCSSSLVIVFQLSISLKKCLLPVSFSATTKNSVGLKGYPFE